MGDANPGVVLSSKHDGSRGCVTGWQMHTRRLAKLLLKMALISKHDSLQAAS